ncbi:carboxypeptidase-like regulatory domain-containing protein [Novipirellula caenicola]
MAEPIGIMERYALTDDREAFLAELIPASDDYYFYHCLHYQTSGQLDRAEVFLNDWLAENKGRETAVIRGMIDRQRLLTYSQTPERTIDHLVKRLGVQLHHPAPPVKGERRYPSQFDVALLDLDRLVREAVQQDDTLLPIGMQRLAEKYRSGETAGLKLNLHDFLARVDHATIKDLDELVIRELQSRRKQEVRFGDLAAHQVLTLAELDRVAAAVPEITDDNSFVSAKLLRLRPSDDVDLSQQPAQRRAYLQRVDAYVRTLPPSYNSLKASSAFRLLEANLAAGVYDRELFLRYLALPRHSPIVHPEWAKRPAPKANLGENFMPMALLPPIGDEVSLVRVYLEHFLKDADNSDAFAELIQPDYLWRVFAETKLMFGIGDEEQWYRLLSPAERQSIRDSVQLRLAPQNKPRFDSDNPAQLIVDIKNVDELVLRIYEINSLAFLRTHQEPLDTDIDLDGLVATHERKLTYTQPAVQRHREILELDEIRGRGVWVVDLVGKGVRARAMIRRGELHHVDTITADGMKFTIVDEDRKPIAHARMIVAGREFLADDSGSVTLPPVSDATHRDAIVSDGELAEKIKFSHFVEDYVLTAGMHLDRTQVQSGESTSLLIRPRIAMGDTPLDPSLLTDVSVQIEAVDLDGITTTKTIEDIKLNSQGDLVVPFRVPARVLQVQASLSGQIRSLSTNQWRRLRTTQQWQIATIRKTNSTHDAFLTRDGDEYVIEVRGRSGEAIAGATVSISLSTHVRGSEIKQTLQTDQQGRVRLSSLPYVKRISFAAGSGPRHTRDLKLDEVFWPNTVHTTTDIGIELPVVDSPDPVSDRYRLIRLRAGVNDADLSDQLVIDKGLLRIKKLAAGDYRLIDRNTAAPTAIAVVDGPVIDHVAVGKIRHREVSPIVPLGVASMVRDAEGLRIQLSGQTDLARVHVFATRYLDVESPADPLHLPMPGLRGRSVSLPRCGYISDLRLGDEYQYVLRRRYAAKYPGVMLPQPSVILNPWETEETSNTSQSVTAGDEPRASAPQDNLSRMRAEADRRSEDTEAPTSDYDFLADCGVTITNLRPDENGVVSVPANLIDGLPLLQIIVTDPSTVIQRTMTAPLDDIETIDLRLAKAIAAEKAVSFERAVTIVSKDKPLDFQQLGSAQLQVYGNVAALLKLYLTLVPDPRLEEFQELATWDQLEKSAKLEAYSRLASHELHLFLKMHDPHFFAEIIKPYLENKKEKQFVDHWLLEDDLKPYTELWKYNQLNYAERALLAIRMPKVRNQVQRELKEWIDLQDTDHQQIRINIESALKANVMFEDFGSDMMMMDDMAEFEGLGGRGGGMGGGGFAFGGGAMPRNDKAKAAPARKKRSLDLKDFESLDRERLGEEEEKRVLGRFSRRSAARELAFFRELDSTKQWAESQWDQVFTVQEPFPSDLIEVDPFWADLALSDSDNPPVSSHLLYPVENRHAALVALAMCGLPLKSGDISLPGNEGESYAPEHPVAVVMKRLRTLKVNDDANSSILVGQRFAAANTPPPSQNRRSEEPKEFLTGVAYKGQTVISNPTANPQTVDVFWQIPEGSLPLSGSQVTDSKTVTLAPFAVHAVEYEFYFPAAGDFPHYPATVASDGELLARAQNRSFNVVDQPTELTSVTWDKVARSGTAAEITDFLASANLRDLDWMLIAHRMQQPDVYQAVIKVLRSANLPESELWAYSLKYRDEPAIRTYLSLSDDLVERVGPELDSPLLQVDAIERRIIEMLEYAPLVRARIHRLKAENEILNSTFLDQYRDFVRVLGFQSEIPQNQRLALTYYLLIQNRIEEAIDTFAKIDRDSIATQLQYDYMDAYLAMHQGQYDRAEQIANLRRDELVPRWQSRFGELANQLRQRRDLRMNEQLVSKDPAKGEPDAIQQGSGDLAVLDREQQQASAADEQPEVLVRVEGDSLRIDHRQSKSATLNLYGVDLELLFSKAPFVREDLQRMAMVKPTRSETLDFDQANGVARYELDENRRRQTLLVEVVAGASRDTALYFGGEMTTYVSESYGQLQASDAKSHHPIDTAYVKVYAKYPDGDVRFYKDGYTDSRGRFDYASVSADDAKGATRFAILVISAEKGASLHDVAPPR